LSPAAVEGFQETVYAHFRVHERHFPWRETADPYAVTVSEIMLQQTQAPRVVPKYEAFLAAFPGWRVLAGAPQADVLRLWQGLGYNRRGLMLHRLANVVHQQYAGALPRSTAELLKLPAIGPYTAAAIQVFAFGQPAVVLETNIRSVLIHHFFAMQDSVDDTELAKLVGETLDREHPRQWYQALMDYGNWLKATGTNPSRRSKRYVRQAPLRGSNREVRGAILRELSTNPSLPLAGLNRRLAMGTERVEPAVGQLLQEGFIVKRGNMLLLA